MTKQLTKKQLFAKLDALGDMTDEQRNEITCALIGHSRICTSCFGYRNCGRCSAQLGDSLGSIDPGNSKAVIIGHECDTCVANFKECTWRDKLFVPEPFTKRKIKK